MSKYYNNSLFKTTKYVLLRSKAFEIDVDSKDAVMSITKEFDHKFDFTWSQNEHPDSIQSDMTHANWHFNYMTNLGDPN